eukprot:TRINITY_DN123033_c0_g1_i1.p2 TRINITY_DN123033_c0_g1~~TRINITY_DN123033_c0_g1_i1.p2  ORF type:complete len:158 (+),score=7.40 TRINITY_DN123033_c0_g1_i1:775-1248(+)
MLQRYKKPPDNQLQQVLKNNMGLWESIPEVENGEELIRDQLSKKGFRINHLQMNYLSLALDRYMRNGQYDEEWFEEVFSRDKYDMKQRSLVKETIKDTAMMYLNSIGYNEPVELQDKKVKEMKKRLDCAQKQLIVELQQVQKIRKTIYYVIRMKQSG